MGWPDAWGDTGLGEIRSGAKREDGGKQNQVMGGGRWHSVRYRCREQNKSGRKGSVGFWMKNQRGVWSGVGF